MKITKLHENGPWSVDDGTFINAYSGSRTNDPAIFIDMSVGSVLKHGDAEMVKRYAATAIERFRKVEGEGILKDLKVIEFDRYPNAQINADEICTMMNYMNNSIGEEKMAELLTMDEPALKEKLHKLAEMGF